MRTHNIQLQVAQNILVARMPNAWYGPVSVMRPSQVSLLSGNFQKGGVYLRNQKGKLLVGYFYYSDCTRYAFVMEIHS